MYRHLTNSELRVAIQADPNNEDLHRELLQRVLSGAVRFTPGDGRAAP